MIAHPRSVGVFIFSSLVFLCKAPRRKFRLVCVDTSRRYKDLERPIVVEEFDGSLRTADWTERRVLMTLYRGRRRKMHKSWKSGLKVRAGCELPF